MDSHRLLAAPEGHLNQSMTQVETSNQILQSAFDIGRSLTAMIDGSGGVLDSVDQRARLTGLSMLSSWQCSLGLGFVEGMRTEARARPIRRRL